MRPSPAGRYVPASEEEEAFLAAHDRDALPRVGVTVDVSLQQLGVGGSGRGVGGVGRCVRGPAPGHATAQESTSAS